MEPVSATPPATPEARPLGRGWGGRNALRAPVPRGVILYAMVTGKLPFKECRPHRMLLLMRRGPTFPPGLSSGECCPASEGHSVPWRG